MYAAKTESPDHGLPLTNKIGVGCFGRLTGAAHQPDQIRDSNSTPPELNAGVGFELISASVCCERVYQCCMHVKKNIEQI